LDLKINQQTKPMDIKSRVELIDITSYVEKEVENSRVREGVCIITTPHTCAGIIINENEPGILLDIVNFLDKLVHSGEVYEHNKIDNNADAHLKTLLLGSSEVIPVVEGKLELGAWQSIFFAEMDGPRDERRVNVIVIKK
jgi:secondary thiamine-phosphate synthase enzyme